MKTPDKIYIAETPNKLIEIWSEEPIESKPYVTEHEYIRKDTLLDWVKEKANVYKYTADIRRSFEMMIRKIESI